MIIYELKLSNFYYIRVVLVCASHAVLTVGCGWAVQAIARPLIMTHNESGKPKPTPYRKSMKIFRPLQCLSIVEANILTQSPPVEKIYENLQAAPVPE